MSHPQPGHDYGERTVGEQYDMPKKKQKTAKKMKDKNELPKAKKALLQWTRDKIPY